MTQQRIPYHARTHLPAGSDPLNLGMPWVLFQGDLDGETIISGTDYSMPLMGAIASPTNAGGTYATRTYGGIDMSDDPIELLTDGASNEPFSAIVIREPGLYYVEVACGWFLDWGKARINPVVTHTDGEESVVSFNGFGGYANSYFQGLTGAGHEQIGLLYTQIYAVDDRATDVRISVNVSNTSGTNRTFNSTTNIGGGGMFIVQWSTTGVSNPYLS